MRHISYIIKTILWHISNFVRSKRFKRYAPLCFIALFAIISFATCIPWQTLEPEPEPIVEVTPDPEPELEPEPEPESPIVISSYPEPIGPVQPEPEEYTGPLNPLTGLPTGGVEIQMNRPLAVVIDNIIPALPQFGVSKADIIYEILVEGGATRMLALFQDPSEAGVIGAVRSARLYTVDLAQSYDAIFMFSGGSPQANAAIRNRRITHIVDGGGRGAQVFYRDRSRRAPHNLMTSGSLLEQHLPYLDLRLEHSGDFEHSLAFAKNGTPEYGSPATTFTVVFSPNAKSTSFSFNEETGLYSVRQHGRDHVDGNTNTQLEITNVLILRMATSGVPGDTAGRLAITTTGSGTGYFVNGGKYIPINWSRADNDSQFVYTLNDDYDTPLILGAGRTYICIIRSNMTVEFS